MSHTHHCQYASDTASIHGAGLNHCTLFLLKVSLAQWKLQHWEMSFAMICYDSKKSLSLFVYRSSKLCTSCIPTENTIEWSLIYLINGSLIDYSPLFLVIYVIYSPKKKSIAWLVCIICIISNVFIYTVYFILGEIFYFKNHLTFVGQMCFILSMFCAPVSFWNNL